MRRAWPVGSLLVLSLFAVPARDAAAAKRAPTTPEPPAPAPNVSLTLVAPSPDAPWTMRIENGDRVPLKLVADARLLRFDVTAPGAKKSVECVLPSSMRPSHDDRTLVIPPGRSYSEKLDPRIFCFGKRDASAVVPGATVVAHLGWPVPARRGRTPRLTAPFVVTPIAGITPEVAAAKEIVAAPVTVGTPDAAAAAAPSAAAEERPLDVSSPFAIDVSHAEDVAVTVSITNRSASNVTFFLRPETLSFDVSGPTGIGVTDPSPTVRCTLPRSPGTPIRELFTTLAPRGRTSLGVLLKTFCPPDTFAHAGVYFVRARLDTRDASGSSIGLRTFDGAIVAQAPSRVRVRGEPVPFPTRRPTLDDAPPAAGTPSEGARSDAR